MNDLQKQSSPLKDLIAYANYIDHYYPLVKNYLYRHKIYHAYWDNKKWITRLTIFTKRLKVYKRVNGTERYRTLYRSDMLELINFIKYIVNNISFNLQVASTMNLNLLDHLQNNDSPSDSGKLTIVG